MTSVVVLGASGRLGRPLLAMLGAAGVDVMAVARSQQVDEDSVNARWISADLTIDKDRSRVVAAVDAWTRDRDHLVVVDAVIDRHDVDAMRRSTNGATESVLRLGGRLKDRGRAWELTVASSTAVLAPRLYQTPYGLAKRRQVLNYASFGIPGRALLLPQLEASHETRWDDGTECWPKWSYERACLQLGAAALGRHSSFDFVLHTPDLAEVPPGMGLELSTVARTAVTAHLRCLVFDRNSMQAHRDAARSRLLLTPHRFQRLVDHHRAPTELVRRFADRHQVTVVRQSQIASEGSLDA